MLDKKVLAFARDIVKTAAAKGLTALELKYACGWASGAPTDRVEAVPVLESDADSITLD